MITNQIMGDKPVIHIGVLRSKSGQLLIGKRKSDSLEYPNKWEFPGGKQEGNEMPFQALQRELKEELGITIWNADPLLSVCYDSHRLFFYLVTDWDGEPQALVHTEIKWVNNIFIPDLINAPMIWVMDILIKRGL